MVQASGHRRHLGAQGIDLILGILTGRIRSIGGMDIRREPLAVPFDSLGLRLDLIPEQLQLLTQALGSVLGKQGQRGSPIHQTTAQPGPETLQSSL